MLVQYTLISLVPILAAAAPSCPAPPPPPPPKPSCGSIHPKWTLDAITRSSYYTYSSPSASGAKLGSIAFTFKNDQVDYVAECKGISVNPQGQFYGTQTFDCVTPGGAAWKKSSFSYEQFTGEIKVNSTWTCGGDVVYQTAGSGKVDLKCKTETWTNPNWKAPELYSNTTTVCEPATLTIQL